MPEPRLYITKVRIAPLVNISVPVSTLKSLQELTGNDQSNAQSALRPTIGACLCYCKGNALAPSMTNQRKAVCTVDQSVTHTRAGHTLLIPSFEP